MELNTLALGDRGKGIHLPRSQIRTRLPLPPHLNHWYVNK